jgi:glycosyltransferase involved in cell wall biosynthesis
MIAVLTAMQTISAYIICFNEAENIKAAAESELWADEIVVVDSNSTDRTADAIAISGGGRKINFGDGLIVARCGWFAEDTPRRRLVVCSVPIRRIAGIFLLGGQQPQHGRPFEYAIRPPCARLVEMRRVRQDVLARHGQLGARRHGVDL